MSPIDYGFLEGKGVLVTGGTGSFGKCFVEAVLRNCPGIERLVVFSRDELKQFEMGQHFSPHEFPQIRYFIGDVRDKDRLRRAFERIDYVVHAAALKQVPAAEYNPTEFIKTNVLGAENVIEAAIDMGVKRVVALSTDKACAPINLYGATKLCSDKLFVAANNFAGGHHMSFSVVRYGNVMGSRGSVIPFFMDKRGSGLLPITDSRMTRFNIPLNQGVDLVLYAIKEALGGEIFVPRIPSYRITDVAEAIAPGAKTEVVGIRPGEKLHEEMVSNADAMTSVERDGIYMILPQGKAEMRAKYLDQLGATALEEDFVYNSGTNDDWLSIEQLRTLIIEHVDPNFVPA
ncbi:MAG: UDP-N-acetylglucosamine 4,6-dehydratase [Alphaproteobacteria bacterium]|jgi:UDP-N-acetylglucosamine 4,6-dehydratase